MTSAKRARRQLKGSWGIAIAAETILFATGAALVAGEWAVWKYAADRALWATCLLPAVALCLDCFLCAPLRLWQAGIYVKAAGDKQNRFTDIRRFFSRKMWLCAVRACGLNLLCDVGTASVCGLPAALFSALRATSSAAEDSLVLWLFGEGAQAMLWLLGALFWVVWRLRRMPLLYLLATENPPSVRAALTVSRRVMRGRVSLCASRILGLIGWGLVSLAVLPLAYTAPLYRTMMADLALRQPLPEHPSRRRRIRVHKKSSRQAAAL